jgi:hypothetical protein
VVCGSGSKRVLHHCSSRPRWGPRRIPYQLPRTNGVDLWRDTDRWIRWKGIRIYEIHCDLVRNLQNKLKSKTNPGVQSTTPTHGVVVPSGPGGVPGAHRALPPQPRHPRARNCSTGAPPVEHRCSTGVPPVEHRTPDVPPESLRCSTGVPPVEHFGPVGGGVAVVGLDRARSPLVRTGRH